MRNSLFFILFIFCGLKVQAQHTVKFHLSGISQNNVKVGIRGNKVPLSWEKSLYLEKKTEYYEGVISFTKSVNFLEYKYVLEDEKGEIIWELEGKDNRLLPIRQGENEAQDTWNVASEIEINDLPLLSPEQLQADINILKEAFLKLHPGIFRYNDLASFEANFKQLKQTFSQAQSHMDAYLAISRFTASIQCGHTYANYFNQPKFIKALILNQKDKLPFGFTWLGKRMIIEKNATNQTQIVSGTEILAINGFTVEQIVDTLLHLVKADGTNEAKRLHDLGIEGLDYYEGFDVYFPLCFPPENGMYQLRLRYPDGKIEELGVESVDRKTRYSILSKRYTLPKKLDETWKFEILRGNIGYLKLGTFTVWNFKMDWKEFLKSTFKTLEENKIKQLILDIRGNEGGLDEVMDVLRNYLWKEDCETADFQTKIRFNKIPEGLRPYISTWDKSLLDMSSKLRKLDDNFYTWKDETENPKQFIKKGKKLFGGKVYILINEANSSATMLLSKKIKACNTATLIGQQTGGSKRGINGGNILFLRLPNSKIEVDIPVYGLFDENAEHGGVKPHIEVKRTLKAIVEQRDETLERTLEVIGR